MEKLADYAEEALKIVKEKRKKATKNSDQSVPSSIRKITVPLYHENRKEEKLNG